MDGASRQRAGPAHLRLGQRQAAVACFERALDLVRRFQDHHNEAVILAHLGETQQAAGDPAAAAKAYREAVAILARLGHPRAEDLTEVLGSLETA